MPPCRLRQNKLWKFDYEMVHSEIYLNKYVVSIAPFSTPAFTPPPIQKTALFACFRFLIFHPFFQGGQLTPFAPMCGRPWSRLDTDLFNSSVGRTFQSLREHDRFLYRSYCHATHGKASVCLSVCLSVTVTLVYPIPIKRRHFRWKLSHELKRKMRWGYILRKVHMCGNGQL